MILNLYLKHKNICRDCFPRGQTVKVRDSTRYEICRRALNESVELFLEQEPGVDSTNANNFLYEFYRCLILLNAQDTLSPSLKISVAKDYFQYAAEICYFGESHFNTLAI